MNKKIMLAATMLAAATTAFAEKVDTSAKAFSGCRLGVSVGYYSGKAKNTVTTNATKLKTTTTRMDFAKQTALNTDYAETIKLLDALAKVKAATKDMTAEETEKYITENGYQKLLLVAANTADLGSLNKDVTTGRVGMDLAQYSGFLENAGNAVAVETANVAAVPALGIVALNNGADIDDATPQATAYAIFRSAGVTDAMKAAVAKAYMAIPEADRAVANADVGILAAQTHSIIQAAMGAAVDTFDTVDGKSVFNAASKGLNAKEVLNKAFNALTDKKFGFLKDEVSTLNEAGIFSTLTNEEAVALYQAGATGNNTAIVNGSAVTMKIGDQGFALFSEGQLKSTQPNGQAADQTPITGAQANQYLITQYSGSTFKDLYTAAREKNLVKDEYNYTSSSSADIEISASSNKVKNTRGNISSGLFFEAGKTMSHGFYIGGRLSGDCYIGGKNVLTSGIKVADMNSQLNTDTLVGDIDPSKVNGLSVKPRFSAGLELQLGYANDRNRFYAIAGGKLAQYQATFSREAGVTEFLKGKSAVDSITVDGVQETTVFSDFVTAPTAKTTVTATTATGTKATKSKKSKTKFGLTLGAGFSTMISSKVFVDVRYEYSPKVKYKFATPTFDVKSLFDPANYGESNSVAITSHKVTLGVGYQF